ncbi:MAG TPA: TRAM domain-containing protein [Acidimicrobiia bacterium]|nr:TRAM domain-containing protein [Acidimicrobiia bacterium]
MDGGPSEDIAVTGIAAGGDGVGRLADGRAVFVRGALPGERLRVALTEEKNRFARAEIVEVLQAAPERVGPPCSQVAGGCGGCDWQHVAPEAQRRLKATIVMDALRRIGKLDPPEPDLGPELPAEGWRTTVRAAVDDEGRAGFRLRHAHEPLALGPEGCLVAHPLVDESLRGGVFPPPVREVTVRAGVATGERLVLCTPKVGGSQVDIETTTVVGADELAGGHRAWFHEVVAGRTWRISAESFFQGRPDGAAALIDTVAAVLGDAVAPGAGVVDLYGGVGLFAGALGERTGGRVVVVESNRSAVADARVNLADLNGARIVRSDVRKWGPSAADVVVADPSRHGLGADVVPRIDATGASALALVSCDPGALGRDAGLLAASGWHLRAVNLVDLFPHTAHVEVVTGWFRGI